MNDGNTFHFKRFAVRQDRCAMRVGTDGVLLGAWCRIDPQQDKAILDIGTGTGVIALQLAQRTEHTNATIEAVEIDPESYEVAKRNFESSLWSKRLKANLAAIQDFARTATSETRYDHIVSNPPYFVDSLTSPDASRTTARHTASLSYEELMSVCDRLLEPAGRISLILPAGAETGKMIATATAHNFVVSRCTEVHSTPKSGPKRTLLEFLRRAIAIKTSADNTVESTKLVIQDGGPGTFSEEYRALTRDFYLYF